MGNGPAIRGLLDLKKSDDPGVIFLSETKMGTTRLDWLKWKLEMPNMIEKPSVGQSGGTRRAAEPWRQLLRRRRKNDVAPSLQRTWT
jgi:hypothetical protein